MMKNNSYVLHWRILWYRRRIIDTETLENVTFANVPCVVFRRETLVIFSQPRIRHCEYLAEKVWILYLRDTGGLSVCQCQRNKKNKKKIRQQTKASGQSSDIKHSLLLLFSWKAKCQTISTRHIVKNIFTLARGKAWISLTGFTERPIPSNILFKQFFLYGAPSAVRQK